MRLDIAFVTETYPPEINGVAMTVGRMVDGLRQRGHRVTVTRPRQHAADRGDGDDTAVAGLPLPGYSGLRFGLPAGRRLRKEWHRTRPDLVHVVTEGPLGWSAVSVARSMGIPVTSGFHTNFDSYSVHYGVGWMRPAVSAYLRTLHRRTQATMVPTEALAAELAGAGIPGVRVVGRGVDTVLFDPARRSAELRSAWGADADTLVCLHVGRLAAEKNLDMVCRAHDAILERRAQAGEVKMVWVGDGPQRKSLQAHYPLHHFAGMRQGVALAAHYAGADLFIFPSLTETYGHVVTEAMASGLPVLAYRSAAAAELIVDGRNGMTVTPGDERAFLDAARRLAGDRGELSSLGAAARSHILPRSWHNVMERFEDVAREVIAG